MSAWHFATWLNSSKYLKKDRLADVLAMIQVLGMDKLAHRSEAGLEMELQGKPRSADTWLQVGKEHPEFFRVHQDKERNYPVSLVARHVVPENDEEQRVLPDSFIRSLLNIAVELHDREAKRSERRQELMRTFITLLAGGSLPRFFEWITTLMHHAK